MPNEGDEAKLKLNRDESSYSGLGSNQREQGPPNIEVPTYDIIADTKYKHKKQNKRCNWISRG